MVSLQFPKDILNFCDTDNCSESYIVDMVINGLSPDTYYSLSYDIVYVKYFNYAIGDIEIANQTFYANAADLTAKVNIKAVGVQIAVIRANIKSDDDVIIASETFMMRCSNCNPANQTENFAVDLDTSQFSVLDNQIQLDCNQIVNLVAVAKNLIPGRKYKYSFRSTLSSDVVFSNKDGELFAGNDLEQNFNTLVFIGAYSEEKPARFCVFFELTDLTSNTSKLTPVYTFSCSSTIDDINCGILADNVHLDLTPKTEDYRAIYLISFYDAVTQQPIEISLSDFSLHNIVYNNISTQNNPLVLHKLNNNSLLIQVDRNLNINLSQTLKFYLKISVSGYIATGHSFTLVDTQSSELIFNLIDYNNLPSSISIDSQSIIVDNTGSTTAPINLVCPASPSKPETCSITIPSGTSFTSKEGYVLRKNIEIQAIHFGSESLSMLPGGTNIHSYLNNQNTIVQQDAALYVYGSVFIQAKDVNNNVGYMLSKQATITIGVDASLQSTNINNSNNLENNDTIPVWLLDPETGVWKMEGSYVYSENNVSISMNAFGMFNLASMSNDLCRILQIPISRHISKQYLSKIKTAGVWVKKTDAINGDSNNLLVYHIYDNVFKIYNLAKRYNNRINTLNFSFYLSTEDAMSNQNSIGSLTYQNTASGYTLCDCETGECI